MYGGAKNVASAYFRRQHLGPEGGGSWGGWGGLGPGDGAGMAFGATPAIGFVPVKAAGGYKTVASAYFRGRGACTQYDPKIILGAKSPYFKGDVIPKMNACK